MFPDCSDIALKTLNLYLIMDSESGQELLWNCTETNFKATLELVCKLVNL